MFELIYRILILLDLKMVLEECFKRIENDRIRFIFSKMLEFDVEKRPDFNELINIIKESFYDLKYAKEIRKYRYNFEDETHILTNNETSFIRYPFHEILIENKKTKTKVKFLDNPKFKYMMVFDSLNNQPN